MKNYSLKVNGNAYEVSVDNVNETEANVVVNGTEYKVEILGGKVQKVVSKPVVAAAPAAAAAPVVKAAPKPAAGGNGSVVCPLPGTVTVIKVKVGDTVAAGQNLAVLEAMKMENNIDAEKAGVVKSINVQAGATVMEGDVLMVIE